jgi:SOS-response transcriptional repressor LexA
MAELDSTKQQIMDLISEGVLKNGCSPSIRELSVALKFASPNGVLNHLKVLVRDGYLKHVPGAARCYAPIELMRRIRASMIMTAALETDALEKASPLA